MPRILDCVTCLLLHNGRNIMCSLLFAANSLFSFFLELRVCSWLYEPSLISSNALEYHIRYNLLNLVDHFHNRGLYRSIFLR